MSFACIVQTCLSLKLGLATRNFNFVINQVSLELLDWILLGWRLRSLLGWRPGSLLEAEVSPGLEAERSLLEAEVSAGLEAGP